MYRGVGFLQRGLARANSVRSFDHAGMATLVVAEHDNKVPSAPHAITACYRQAPRVRVQRSFTWYRVCSMQSIKSATLNTITAATKLGDDVHLLVAGKDCAAAAAEGSKVLVGHPASIYTEVACSCHRPCNVLTRRVCAACPAQIAGVKKVLSLDHASLANFLAENVVTAVKDVQVCAANHSPTLLRLRPVERPRLVPVGAARRG